MSLRYCFACSATHRPGERCPRKAKWSGRKVTRLRGSIYERDRGTCQDCGQPVEFSDFELDHIQSRSMGGSDDPDNLQVTCSPCNQRKGG